ncbi:unnamed protein product [Adineta steineri]|uniref:Uncharacterized protein n=1 Tax=Adineta steineri TaxID=433720 RepID=A0A819LL99_9BILA|nr:unnamed protein product [Adineta steineri]CAF3967165.1 unnamed protein product [Adineta steineri]
MATTNEKVSQKSKQSETTHKSMDQQTKALASLALTTPNKQSTTSKCIPTTEDTDDVIYTNHFPCSFVRDLTFYQYDAIVEEYHEKQNKYINVSSREKRRQFVSDLFLAKTIHQTAVCWYDEGSCIYSTTDFQDKLPFVYENEEQRYRYRLTIKSLSATSSTNDLDQSSIRIIETLIKQVLKEQFKSIGSVFYRWDAEVDRDGFYDLLTGFKQALCLTESGPTLNLDTTITRFYPHSDLLPFIWERVLMQAERPFHGQLTDRQYDQISNCLRDVEVTTVQSDHQKKYVLTGRFSDPPGNIPIQNQRNLLDYYKDLGFPLRYPQLYCLQAYPLGNPQRLDDLPIELCSLREWQQVKEDESMKPVPAPLVSKRFSSIMEAIRNCNFRDNELCKEIQLEVDCDKMMAVPYETLTKRQVILSRRGGFTNPVPVGTMAFIYLTDRQQSNARQLQEKLLNSFYDAASRQNMRLPKNPDEYEIFADRNLENTLRDRLSNLKNKQYQFVLCLENCRNTEIHQLFKQIAYEYGLATQCANFTKIQQIPNLRSYCNNFLLSVNTKLSGENKQVAELQTHIKTMFIGADVQHTKNNYTGELPSIAAVVASMNSECTLTNQRESYQWPNKGKQSEEAILLLQTMVEELLIAFKDNNKGSLPEHIVFYRDGVDDGQFKRVQDEEVTALKKAFQAIYSANSGSPLLTFIVVKKRHHTRLFRLLPSSNVNDKSDRVVNVESGVVVDTVIVNENSDYPNFFLNSHEPRLGTNKIGDYVILVDEIQYSLSDWEEITYSLCHTDQRIDNRSSESIPSIVHLADAAASKARSLFGSRERPSGSVRAEILRVHEDIQDKPNMF